MIGKSIAILGVGAALSWVILGRVNSCGYRYRAVIAVQSRAFGQA